MLLFGCFRYFKDTKMKANHNDVRDLFSGDLDVSDTSKITTVQRNFLRHDLN